MTLAELQSRYHELSTSIDPKHRAKAKGFLDIITLYRENCNGYESEPVKISMLAEDYVKQQDKIYSILKKEEFRQKVQAGMECIIKYSTTDEISKAMASYSTDEPTLANYLNYMKGVGLMDKTKYADFVSAYNLLIL